MSVAMPITLFDANGKPRATVYPAAADDDGPYQRLAVCLCAKPHTSIETAEACRSRMLTVIYYPNEPGDDNGPEVSRGPAFRM